ncbi:MAG: phosphoribosylglycinamide formyltransferase [Bacteroidales bacterium]|nr:phosphoribosylglycinamide formyltransferase [Bacteroidales bacterium]
MKNLAVFASGNGSNAENLVRYFSKSEDFKVSVIICNNPNAGVLRRAENLGVPVMIFSPRAEDGWSLVAKRLEEDNIYAIILAGFLALVPQELLDKYPDRIINIHPALLPKYGGKGMHGMHVHEAVVEAKERETGITVHLIDEQYDHGKILFQAKCDVLPCDTPMEVAAKIHLLEQEHFPSVVDDYLSAISL